MSIYARLATTAPVDRQAARTLGMRGATWEPNTRLGNVRLIAPPPLKPVPAETEDDLTGQEFGRLRVVGMAAAYANPARWVVRCACGTYEFRKGRVLRGGPPERSMCSHCDHLSEMVAGRKPALLPLNA